MRVAGRGAGVVREASDEVTLALRRAREPRDGGWSMVYQVGEGGTSSRDSKASGTGWQPSKEKQEVKSERQRGLHYSGPDLELVNGKHLQRKRFPPQTLMM